MILRKLVYFYYPSIILILASTYLVANEVGYKEVYSSGRAVIIENNVDLAKKRALEDALYLASIQGGQRSMDTLAWTRTQTLMKVFL